MNPFAVPLRKRVSERLGILGRDLQTVANDWLGRRPPPFAVRTTLGRHSHVIPSSTELLAPRPAIIKSIHRETRDAVSLEIESDRLDFHPGQFLTLVVKIDGELHRRAYSISTAPHDGRVTVTVKRIEGGRVSSYLVERARPGESIQILGPSGSFGLTPDANAERNVVLIGGGSGITPLISIARAVLHTEPRSRVTLIYGNRAIDDIIFKTKLDELAADERFTLRHVLEAPPAKWSGGVGRLDEQVCGAELDRVDLMDAEVFLCGPDGMMKSAREAVLARGVTRLHEEKFTSPTQRVVKSPTEPQPITIRARGRESKQIAQPGQTLLEAGLAGGVAMPFSCAMGGCGVCKVKLLDGEIAAEEPNCLTSDEREQGYVLACVSRACTPATIAIEEAS